LPITAGRGRSLPSCAHLGRPVATPAQPTTDPISRSAICRQPRPGLRWRPAGCGTAAQRAPGGHPHTGRAGRHPAPISSSASGPTRSKRGARGGGGAARSGIPHLIARPKTGNVRRCGACVQRNRDESRRGWPGTGPEGCEWCESPAGVQKGLVGASAGVWCESPPMRCRRGAVGQGCVAVTGGGAVAGVIGC